MRVLGAFYNTAAPSRWSYSETLVKLQSCWLRSYSSKKEKYLKSPNTPAHIKGDAEGSGRYNVGSALPCLNSAAPRGRGLEQNPTTWEKWGRKLGEGFPSTEREGVSLHGLENLRGGGCLGNTYEDRSDILKLHFINVSTWKALLHSKCLFYSLRTNCNMYSIQPGLHTIVPWTL